MWPRAHPRSRGENIDRYPRHYCTAGSSPLTRGKHARGVGETRTTRLIPAHAGKTQMRSCAASRTAAHPRSRGENHAAIDWVAQSDGSSPLTRGKPTIRALVRRIPGLIPAHAGKTSCGWMRLFAATAHPRSRGENVSVVASCRMFMGSSPLTRGKLAASQVSDCVEGLIPAHAGKTTTHGTPTSAPTAHPRSRGENPASAVKLAREGGSSPLTRGKHFPTCAFTAQIDQILETLELAVSSGSYSIWVACATDAPQDQVRSIGLVLPSSRGAS